MAEYESGRIRELKRKSKYPLRKNGETNEIALRFFLKGYAGFRFSIRFRAVKPGYGSICPCFSYCITFRMWLLSSTNTTFGRCDFASSGVI